MDINLFHALDIILVGGIYGSGKTDIASKYFRDQIRLRISRSEIRKLMYEMTNFGKPWTSDSFNENDDTLVKHIERKILEHYVHNKQKILIINTFATTKSRKRFIELARTYGRSIGIIFVNRPIEQCVERNKKSGQVVSEMVIRSLHNKMELPVKNEGFAQVAVLGVTQ